jgi:hypothetical protein
MYVSVMNRNYKPMAAFILSLLSGVFIVISSAIMCLWWNWWWPMGWSSMMHEMEEHMPWWDFSGITNIMGILGIIFGIIIIIVAVLLYINPKQHELYGALIIIFSVISIISCMGGMGIGLLLGIVGGILAILWKPEEIKPS